MNISNIQSNQQSFTARTKEGNNYDRTCAGKVAGGMIGINIAAKNVKKIQRMSDNTYIKRLKSNFAKMQAESEIFRGPEAEIKFAKNLEKNLKIRKALGSVIAAGISLGLWFGLGAIVDKIINNHQAHKADREAE